MSSLIKNLRIQNFKSVRDLSLDCDRINIFIGKPNAGKSNILEAISLLGAGYSEGRFMEGMVRYNALYQLFNNFDTRSPILIVADEKCAGLERLYPEEIFQLSVEPAEERKRRKDAEGYDEPADYDEDIKVEMEEYGAMHRYVSIQSDGKVIAQKEYGFDPEKAVKRYEFKLQNGSKGDFSFLTPPHGGNFYNILRSHLELREEIQEFLKPNGLELLLDEENKRVSILQREAASVLSFPLYLVPDTFQRYIFHLAAIMSNRNSVLLFEEPESHSYPPYVYQLAQYILDDEGGNQFFITTHNPYFLLPIMQEGKDVAVFVTWFKDYQTHARRLTEEELSEVLNYGVDLFLNLDHFIPE